MLIQKQISLYSQHNDQRLEEQQSQKPPYSQQINPLMYFELHAVQ